jgi:cbb3-type cytochrome oxidase cytochrome c subunit
MTDYVLESLRKRYKRVTTEMVMDASGVPREDWEGEMIAELPRRMQAKAQQLADAAREEVRREQEKDEMLKQNLCAYLRTDPRYIN